MNDYMQTQADELGLTVKEYLDKVSAMKEQELIDQYDLDEDEPNFNDYDLPEDWEPDLNGTDFEEVREQMNHWKSLK